MKQIFFKQTKYFIYVSIVFVSILLPVFVQAEISISNENKSEVYSDIQVVSNGNAQIEVLQTTVVNGKEYTYYYSTTSPKAINHQVEIKNGEVLSASQNNQSIQPSSEESDIDIEDSVSKASSSRALFEQRIEEEELSWLINVINYLYSYVGYIF